MFNDEAAAEDLTFEAESEERREVSPVAGVTSLRVSDKGEGCIELPMPELVEFMFKFEERS